MRCRDFIFRSPSVNRRISWQCGTLHTWSTRLSHRIVCTLHMFTSIHMITWSFPFKRRQLNYRSLHFILKVNFTRLFFRLSRACNDNLFSNFNILWVNEKRKKKVYIIRNRVQLRGKYAVRELDIIATSVNIEMSSCICRYCSTISPIFIAQNYTFFYE